MITVIYPADKNFNEGAKAFRYTGPVGGGHYPDLELIFRQCNHVDGSEWIANRSYRSMSVGDIVIIDGDTWEVAGSGWNKLA